jgi:hypothetical protein
MMIKCKVCGKENEELSTVCVTCGSFVQGKIDALHLFSTFWGLIESPRQTFRKVVLARHKNYAVLLSGLFGVCLVFDVAWFKKIGNEVSSIIPIVGAAVVGGPLIGVGLLFVLSFLLQYATKMFGGHATRRNLWAGLSYATMPMVFSLVFIIPLELAIFGLVFFGTNPPPDFVRPTEYYLLLGLKGAAALWTIYLMVQATMSANGFGRNRILHVVFSVGGLCIMGAVVLYLVRL